ncbi:SpoIIE family protein phosphatase [Cyclobacteriaceae bacterium]|nr:SpoIIE family protein phosphatase [Cyclobacteriaceae bacterium]
MKNKTIFQQLVVKVIFPVVIALVALAAVNIHNSRATLIEFNNRTNQSIADEIQIILESQDFSLDIIEKNLDADIKRQATYLVNEVFKNTDSIETADLYSLRQGLGVDSSVVDFYIINKQGVIVNTTFESDSGKNTFNDFGTDFKNYILDLLTTRGFNTGDFTPEDATGKLRKYSYFSTLDGKYIIELGSYSYQADIVVQETKRVLKHLNDNNKNIKSIDLFIGRDNPVSFNNKLNTVAKDHIHLYQKVIENSKYVLEDKNTTKGYTDTQDTVLNIDGQKLNYQYTFMPRDSEIYKNSVIRIVSDRSREDAIVNQQIMKFAGIFGGTILVLIILIMFTSKSITNHLSRLIDKVNVIGEGDFSQRVNPSGSKEILALGKNFNVMLDKIEGFYNELEDKVRERTAEILQQKEEIEAQRDQIEEQRDKVVKINESLESAYLQIEEQNKRITDSIHYAKRIQNAILPSKEYLTDVVEKHFVLYKPKDIVSGDFYWASDKGTKSIIAAADCTGHGVPGAFMSMIGNTVLNKVVNENSVTTPSEILGELRTGIITSLNSTEQKDGMDIAVLCYDRETRTLQYSGANNPMYLVRSGELTVIKGDKQPVGYFLGKETPFTNHEINILPGDMVYIFSDGYQDQFGGERDTKFMVGRFKKLIVANSTTTVDDQCQILDDTIEEWMEETKQIDDILVIGIKF